MGGYGGVNIKPKHFLSGESNTEAQRQSPLHDVKFKMGSTAVMAPKHGLCH